MANGETAQLHLDRGERLTIGALLLGGLGVFLVGAALASSLGVWSLDRQDRVAALAAGSADVWRAGNLLLALGVVLTSAGVAALAARAGNAPSVAGAGLWLVAGAIGGAGFVLQGEGALAVVAIVRTGGTVPAGFWPLDAWQEAMLTFYSIVGMLGSGVLGIGLLRIRRLSPVIGRVAVVGGFGGAAALIAGFDVIPAIVQFLTAVFAAAILPSVGPRVEHMGGST